MNKLIDLRFVIGSFFLIVGLLLLLYHFVAGGETDVNLWCGGSFAAFGLLMIVLSFQKDANDELLEDTSSTS
jgi:hypothetical protein